MLWPRWYSPAQAAKNGRPSPYGQDVLDTATTFARAKRAAGESVVDLVSALVGAGIGSSDALVIACGGTP